MGVGEAHWHSLRGLLQRYKFIQVKFYIRKQCEFSILLFKIRLCFCINNVYITYYGLEPKFLEGIFFFFSVC